MSSKNKLLDKLANKYGTLQLCKFLKMLQPHLSRNQSKMNRKYLRYTKFGSSRKRTRSPEQVRVTDWKRYRADSSTPHLLERPSSRKSKLLASEDKKNVWTRLHSDLWKGESPLTSELEEWGPENVNNELKDPLEKENKSTTLTRRRLDQAANKLRGKEGKSSPKFRKWVKINQRDDIRSPSPENIHARKPSPSLFVGSSIHDIFDSPSPQGSTPPTVRTSPKSSSSRSPTRPYLSSSSSPARSPPRSYSSSSSSPPRILGSPESYDSDPFL